MKTKKFIANIKAYLGLDDLEIKSKRKSVNVLLKKLKSKHAQLTQSLKEDIQEQELNEELDIIALHIKKAEAILKKLNEKKEKKNQEKI